MRDHKLLGFFDYIEFTCVPLLAIGMLTSNAVSSGLLIILHLLHFQYFCGGGGMGYLMSRFVYSLR